MADPISAAILAFQSFAIKTATAATLAITGSGAAAIVASNFVAGMVTLGAAGGGLAATLGTAAGFSAISSALSPKPQVNATATQLQTKVGATTPRAIIMGRAPIAGTVLTPTPLKSGKDDRFASNFYALSHAGPSGVVESVIWGDDTVTFDANGNAIGKYNDNMWLFQKNGDWNQTAISYSGHAVLGSSTPSAWDSTKRARGCLTVALVVRYAAKVLGGNMQTPIFVVDANAAVLIDPRTGSPATTQAQRRNPAVWAYSWRLGWFQNSKRVIGMGQASGELHAAGYAYAANVADANGWVISGEATTADDRYAVETAILQACASTPVERNGLQSVVTSALRSSVGTITSNDLRADPKWRYNTQQSSRPTAIQTRYRSESNRWQMVEGAEVTDASWLTQDAGREKRVMVEYAYAGGGSAHVGHLAALEASNAREPLVFNLQCKQQARYAGFVGDAVTVSLPEIGLSSTKMTVQGRIVNSDGTVDYELLVETDAKYDFAAGKTSAAPSFTLQPGFDINDVPQPGAAEWASVAAQITSGGITSLPIVRVTGSAADYSFCTGIVFKLRLNSGGSPWVDSVDVPPSVTQHEFRGLTNATSYIVGISYRGVTGVEGPIRELAAVTTGVLLSGEASSVPWDGVTGGGKPADNATVNRITASSIAPASPLNGDIWVDTTSPVTIYTRITGSWIPSGNIPTSLGQVNSTEGTKLTGIAVGATKNIVTTGLLSARPTGADGDFHFATDTQLLYQKVAGSWVVSANNYTDTNQLTDGAGLGQTAIWSNVSGTGKPADNATVNRITSSTTAPASPVNGDIWVDTNSPVTIKTRVSGSWVSSGNIPTSLDQVNSGEGTKLTGIAIGATKNVLTSGTLASRPTGADGDFHYATDTQELYQKVGGAWVLASTVGARVGVNIYPGSGSTPLPGTQLLNESVPAFGANLVRYSRVLDTSKHVAGFNNTGFSAPVIYGISEDEGYVYRQAVGTVAGASSFAILHSYTLNSFSVAGLTRVEASVEVYMTTNNAIASTAWGIIYFYDSAGTQVGSSFFANTTLQGGWIKVEAFVAVPSTAKFAILASQMDAGAGSISPFIGMRRAFCGAARADQTAFSTYIVGTESDQGADVTATKTAAAIAGQGTGATANNLTGLNPTEGSKLGGIEAGADVTANAVPSLEGPASVNFDVDSAGALDPAGQVPRTLQFIRKRGNTDVSATTTWSIVSPVNVTLGTITNGGVNVTAVAAGLSNFTVRSVRDGVTLDLLVNVIKNTIAAGVASAVRKVDQNSNGTANNGSWQTIATVTFSNCPGGNVYLDGSAMTVATGTGTCDHKARITIDGTLAGSELATQNTVTGGTPSAVIFDDLFAQILAVSAGSRTIAFQLQRTSGTGTIDTSSTYFDVKAFPT